MNGIGHMTDSQSSSQGTKRKVPTKKYFTVQEDYCILDKFKRKGMVKANDIVEDIALAINRDPATIKERYKKLNGLTEEDKLKILNFVKNQVEDPSESYVFFAKPPSRKIECIKREKPSIYYMKKTDDFGKKRHTDNDDEYYDNTVYDQKPEIEDQYIKTISMPTDLKLKDIKPINDPCAAYSSALNPRDDLFTGGFLLGKRELDPNVDLREGTPMKQSVGEGAPFGLLNQNTLETDKKAIPKYDKDKNIVLTPKTKEEEESNQLFLNDLLENLAKVHNMDVGAVFKFALSLNSEVISYDKVNQALLMINEPSQPQPKKKMLNPKKSTKSIVTGPIR